MNLIGKMLNNRYEVLEKIGNGGMALVYKAKCHILNRYVAVKVLKDEFTTDSEFIKKFNTEAQSAASLNHPNIVSIFDVCNEDNLYYIVMELIQGKTLKEIITEDGRLSWKWSVNIAIQIASALETAHKNNIIHRDIKPHNIIITEDGIAKVTDFGIAKAVSNSTITAFGTTIGSVHYFSPEHARGGYTDAKSDLYSLGIVMYEMLTGKVPFDADTPVSVALKQVQEEPVDPMRYNDTIPVSVNRIILKAMQKDPNLRYQNATEMLRDLSLALKKPNEDFVVLATRSDDSPTQKIPTIYELEMEKNNDRKAPRVNQEETTSRKKENKVKAFYSNHKWAGPVTGVLVAILLFVFAMYGTIAILNGNRPDQVAMPNLIGDEEGVGRVKKEDAIKQLEDLGFEGIKVEEEYSDTVEEGYVIKQTPEYAGEEFRINVNDKITLVVSKGQKIVTLPKKMVGKKIEDVTKELDELELKYETIEENSETVEAGVVIAVNPEEGEEITAATVIQLTVSIGSAFKDVSVPSVLNQAEGVAIQTLSDLGLVVNVNYEENASKSDGVVISQSVSGGKTLKEGDSIELIVNKQPAKSTLTVKVNLMSLMNYTEPEPTITETVDEEGNTVTTTNTPQIEKATVVLEVGEDTILSDSYSMNRTDITKSWTTSGVKILKVKVNGVTKYEQTVDFNKGDQTVTVK
ncbi:MAG: Stk1 family PASTA domain-containing Ser/Thr kinase [Clostridia bacterium]|nr:Stk1 family PASTA domain-containing Ser/Thr kinase [Clostridia bacterium]